ncbi:VOC family protein [Tabrizicola sp.]|uniref:VOC family protein n=1 Tax=Tabrizicola sp. TaxID=2005166 RepID=UPI0025F891A1|nr:VOC family protein [Tabrizicola sp.]
MTFWKLQARRLPKDGTGMDLNQVTIPVRDFEEGVAFCSVLGFRQIVHNGDGRYARFELPSGSTTLSLYEDRTACPGDTVLYLEVDDVDRKYADLRAAGLVFQTAPADQDWRWREAHFVDPTGNRFCPYHAGAEERRFPPWRLNVARDE